MEFIRGYTQMDNSWWSEGGPFTRLTPDEQTILSYLSSIIIRTGPFYKECGLLNAKSRTDTIEQRCNIKNFRRWKAMERLEEKGFLITIRKRGRHNLYLLGMIDEGYERLKRKSGYDAVKAMKKELFFADSKYIEKFGKIPADIISFIQNNYKDSKMIKRSKLEGYGNTLFDVLFNPEIPPLDPSEKVVSMEKHRELMRMINEIKPNRWAK
jgi:hypothetical protein